MKYPVMDKRVNNDKYLVSFVIMVGGISPLSMFVNLHILQTKKQIYLVKILFLKNQDYSIIH